MSKLDKLLCKIIGHKDRFVWSNQDNYYMKNFCCDRCGKHSQRFV